MGEKRKNRTGTICAVMGQEKRPKAVRKTAMSGFLDRQRQFGITSDREEGIGMRFRAEQDFPFGSPLGH